MNGSKSIIPSLTPLRGVAALGVFLLHVTWVLPALQGSLIDAGVINGVARLYLGVDFFFMLSGYLLCSLYAPRLKQWSTPGVLRFWWLRWSRIYPLLFITSSVLLVAQGVLGGPWEFARWRNDVMMLNMAPGYFPALNTPSWSLSAEWAAYLCAPFLFMAVIRLPVWGSRLLLAGSFGVITMFALSGWNSLDRATVMRAIPGFCIGACLATGGFEIRRPRLASTIFTASSLLFLAAIFLLPRSPGGDVTAYAFLIGVLLSAPYISGLPGAMLNNRFFEWLGTVSFSVYLWHVPIVTVFLQAKKLGWISYQESAVTELLWFSILLGITLLVSRVSYRWIETGCREYLVRKYTKSRRPGDVRVPAPASPAPVLADRRPDVAFGSPVVTAAGD